MLRCALAGVMRCPPSVLISAHTAVHQRFSSAMMIFLLLSGSSAKRLLTIALAACLAAIIAVIDIDIWGRSTAGEDGFRTNPLTAIRGRPTAVSTASGLTRYGCITLKIRSYFVKRLTHLQTR